MTSVDVIDIPFSLPSLIKLIKISSYPCESDFLPAPDNLDLFFNIVEVSNAFLFLIHPANVTRGILYLLDISLWFLILSNSFNIFNFSFII